MAITVVSDQTLVNTTGGDAESLTNWTVTAAWSTAKVLDGDSYLQGANAIGARASATAGPTLAMFWDHLTTGTANLNLTGTGQHIFFWIKCIALPSHEARVRGGLGLSVSSGTDVTTLTGTAPWNGIGVSKQWFLSGNDFDPVSGWVCYVVDPATTPDLTIGSPDMTSVDRIGIRVAMLQIVGAGSFKPHNILWDRISYGTKLTITGSTGTFQDIFAADSLTANQYGILQKSNGIFLGGGKLIFGTTGQTAPCVMTDTKQTLVWQDFRVASGFYEIQLVGNTTPNITTVTLGTYSGGLTSGGCTIRGVGLESQRLIAPVIVSGGTTYVVNDILTVVGGTSTQTAQFKVTAVSGGVITGIVMERAGSYSVPPTGTLSVTDARNNSATFTATVVGGSIWTLTASAANQTLNLYACSLSEMLSAALTSTSTLRGCTIINSGTVTAGGALIDNCTFQDVRTTTPISATYALIVNSSTEMANITNSKFVNCNRAVKITAGGTYTFDNLTFSGNVYDIEFSASAATEDSYSQTNQDGTTTLSVLTPTGAAQSFTGAGGTLSSVKLYLKKTGSPTGSAVAKIYAHSGTFGTSSVPTGAALATSDNLAVSSLTTTLALTSLQFSGSNNIVLTNTTKYVVALEYSGGGVSDNIQIGYDGSSPGHGGNYSTLSGVWLADSGKDMCFFVHTGANITINAVNGSNPSNFINTGDGSTTITNSKTLTITVVDSTNTPIQNAQTAIYKTSDNSQLMNTDTNASGVATTTFNYLVDTSIYVRIRKSSTGDTKYMPFSTTGTITSTGFSLVATLVTDPNA